MKKYFFHNGMDKNIRETLMMKAPATYDDVKRDALLFETTQFQLNLHKRKIPWGAFQGYGNRPNTHTTTRDPNAMDIDAVAIGALNKLSEKERQACRDNNLCFRCRKNGHFARECPNKEPRNPRTPKYLKNPRNIRSAETGSSTQIGNPEPPRNETPTPNQNPDPVIQIRAILESLDEDALKNAIEGLEKAGF